MEEAGDPAAAEEPPPGEPAEEDVAADASEP
jgi:hypothetical protein